MSRLTCSFCTHSNPEGSKFCNECGSPLHLVPCTQCEAINNESDARCCRCGAPLSAAAVAPIAEGPALATEIAHAEPGAAISSVPIALADQLADHLDAFPWNLRTKAEPERAAAVEEDSPSSAEAEAQAVAAPVAVTEVTNAVVDEAPDDVPLPPVRHGRVEYHAAGRRRTSAVVVGAALLGVAAVIYWSAADHTRPVDSPVTDPAPTGAATSASRGPEAQAPAAGMPPESREPAASTQLVADQPRPVADQPQPVADHSPSNPDPSEAAASAPPSAGADIPPRVAASPPEKADAPAPAPRKTVPAVAAKGAADKGHGAGEARRRAAAQGRTKEQAERDALATQRLIARDLAATPRAPSNAPPATAP